VLSFAVRDDGLEALTELARGEVALWRRARLDAAFRYSGIVSSDIADPSFSPDGLAMLAVRASTGELAIATRDSLEASFGAPTFTTFANLRSPTFGGSSEVFAVRDLGIATELVRLRRTGPSSFSAPETVFASSVIGELREIAYDARRRELIFTSNRPWSPLPRNMHALWRAEVCSSGECLSRAVPCAAARSPDELHCYRRDSGLRFWSEGRTLCRSTEPEREHHLVTLHSAAEQAFVVGDVPVNYWVGGQTMPDRWVSGEAWSQSFYATGEPNGTSEDCVRLTGLMSGSIDDDGCNTDYGVICEDELWPTW
jgi:hypothetical protein